MWRVSVLTLFPDIFPGPLGASLAGKALQAGVWSLDAVDIRAFATDRHRTVDDTPAGGGPGMVMKPDVLGRAIDAMATDERPRLLLSPRGLPLTQARVETLARGPGIVLVCGRFEGVDERVIAARSIEEVSIGDYVLSGGEVAAMVLIDACDVAGARHVGAAAQLHRIGPRRRSATCRASARGRCRRISRQTGPPRRPRWPPAGPCPGLGRDVLADDRVDLGFDAVDLVRRSAGRSGRSRSACARRPPAGLSGRRGGPAHGAGRRGPGARPSGWRGCGRGAGVHDRCTRSPVASRLAELHHMDVEVARLLLGVDHLGRAAWPFELAGVARLAAALGVEGRAVEDDLHGLPASAWSTSAPSRTMASTSPVPSTRRSRRTRSARAGRG